MDMGYDTCLNGKCIDTVPPVTTVNCNNTACMSGCAYDNDISISLSCWDAGSGCKNTFYCLSSSCTPNIPYSGQIPFGEGINYVRFNSIDNAGNSEAVKTQIVEINKTKSMIVIINTSSIGAIKAIVFSSQITPATNKISVVFNPSVVLPPPDSNEAFKPYVVLPPSIVVMNITADRTTPAGVYNITVFGVSEEMTVKKTYRFTVG
jgi:hypothetical protein